MQLLGAGSLAVVLLPEREGTNLQSHNTKTTDRHEHLSSCEIIQDIFGLGANCFLREDEEELFQRMLLKYRRQSKALRNADAAEPAGNERDLELLIRRTLFLRKTELSISTNVRSAQKEIKVSATARTLTGTAGKGVGDSLAASHRSRLA